jgi:cell division protein FtsB
MRRLALPGILLLAAYYAVFGGEHSVLEVRRARRAVGEEQAQLDERRRVLDSLQAWADSLEVDPATLERIARERFGMIKPGETLYRFAEEDDTTAVTDSARDPGR